MVDTSAVRAFLDPKHIDLAERVSEFATRLLTPLAEPTDDDAARHQARDLLGKLGAAGWFEPIGAQDWRGCCIIREALAASSPLADAVFALQALGVVPMLLSANDAMRKRWLDPAIRGRSMASFAMTEPEAGSDVAALGATAQRDGGGWILSGTKTFISNAGIADFYTVFATTDRTKRDKGIGCFVVPADTPGLRFVRPLVLSSPHPLGEIAFQNVRIPGECRLDPDG
ncbi:MAG: acyl-CoA dehydrogenase family protein, partial [Gemmatimonadales bacterium]